jgi:hypothetical protein
MEPNSFSFFSKGLLYSNLFSGRLIQNLVFWSLLYVVKIIGNHQMTLYISETHINTEEAQ